MIDLRSDVVTRPTAGMRAVMAAAEVGDEQAGEDPTAARLEERVTALLGHEEAVFVPSATMGNQIALRLLTRPGDEVLGEARCHVFRYELGGPTVHSGLVMTSNLGGILRTSSCCLAATMPALCATSERVGRTWQRANHSVANAPPLDLT